MTSSSPTVISTDHSILVISTNRREEKSPPYLPPLAVPNTTVAHTIIPDFPGKILFMDRIRDRLLQVLVFLIPTNMFFYWDIPGAYIHGKLIDYLLPKLYLSDIPILGLITLFILNSSNRLLLKKQLIKYKFTSFIIFCLLVYLLVQSLTHANPLPSLWYLVKILEFLSLGIALTLSFRGTSPGKILLPALVITLLFQLSLGIYQFTSGHSLIGYKLLGEPTLTLRGNIAQTSFLGRQTPLSYGTTAHPNLLAGIIVIFLIWILEITEYNLNQKLFNITFILAICLFITTLLLTQSLSAMIGFILVQLLYPLPAFISTTPRLSQIRLVVFSILISGVIIILGRSHSPHKIDSNTITRRYKLFQSSIELLKSSPVTGIGLNQFIPALITLDQNTVSYTFPQPVHNIYALWTTETGFLGLACLIWILISLAPRLVPRKPNRALLVILIIGLVDHYPLTLQSGLLLTTLSLSLW